MRDSVKNALVVNANGSAATLSLPTKSAEASAGCLIQNEKCATEFWRERRKITHRRIFVTVLENFLQIKLWATVALLSMSAYLRNKYVKLLQIVTLE